MGGLFFKKVHDIFHGQEAITEGVVDFIQNDQIVLSRQNLGAGRLPGLADHALINFNILAFPRETVSHRTNFESP